mgnify:CR=1 FL=1
MPYLSAARCIGMQYMVHSLLGTGMCMTTDCMHMFSQLIPIVCGGTGDGLLDSTDRDGDGILHIITVAGTLHGMAVTGVMADIGALVATGASEVTGEAATGPATGDQDGIILIMDGVADGTDQYTTLIIHEKLK